MNIQSDKQVKIYNIIPIIYFDIKNQAKVENLSISLTLDKTKFNWFFFSKFIDLNYLTHNSHYLIQSKYNVIILISEHLADKNLKYIKKLCYLFGKKILIISNKINKDSDKEFIFNISYSKNNRVLKKKIKEIINTI